MLVSYENDALKRSGFVQVKGAVAEVGLEYAKVTSVLIVCIRALVPERIKQPRNEAVAASLRVVLSLRNVLLAGASGKLKPIFPVTELVLPKVTNTVP